jgi:hypothetical protein
MDVQLQSSLDPGWSLAQFDHANFVAFLQQYVGSEIQNVVFNPKMASKGGATTIEGDLAVIRELVDNFARRGESASS